MAGTEPAAAAAADRTPPGGGGACWAFDVDGCLVDSLTGTSLRPGAADLLARLRAAGTTVVVWSAGGADHARGRADVLGFAHLVDAFHDKGERDGDGRYVPPFGAAGVVFVDDRPEDMPVGADVVAVSPYLSPDPHDRGLAALADRAPGGA